MTDKEPDTDHDRTDRGLRAAYGSSGTSVGGGRRSARSILEVLEKEHGFVSQVSLAADEDSDPMLKPASEDLRRQLRQQNHYQVLGQIAVGGVGVVLRSHDRDLGRDVAMKVLHERYADNSSIIQRFVEEAQIGGQLQHPGIVPVYEIGLQADKRPYFTMKLVKGRTLAVMLAERGELVSQRQLFLSIFLQVCQTMAYAHSRSVIHRDLKPANVMVGTYGEVKVVDWGFAKVLGQGGSADEARASVLRTQVSIIETVRSQDEGTASVAGSVMGTPAYMPPEQAAGQVELLNERSDVFSLGAILCEILTGHPPYTGEKDEILLKALRCEQDEAKERLRSCGAEAELVQLVLDCLSPERLARPKNGGEVAGRLQEHLASVQDRARRAEVAAAEARVQAVGERKARKLTLALGVAVVLVIGVASLGWMWVEASRRDADARSQAVVTTALGSSRGLLEQAEHVAEARPLLQRARDVCSNALETVRAQDAGFDVSELEARRDDIDRHLAEDQADADLLRALAAAPTVEIAILRASIIERTYARALAAYGLSKSMSDDEIVDKVKGRKVVKALARGLDSWGMTRLRSPSLRSRAARLFRLAERLDNEDPWRRKIRAILPQLATEDDDARAAACKLVFKLAEEMGPDRTTAANGLLLGEALFNGGDQEAAVEVYRRTSQRNPEDYLLHLNLGLLLERSKPPTWEASLSEYRQARALRPNDHRPWLGCARVALATQRKELFARCCAEVERRAGNSALAWITLAREYATDGDFDRALAAADRAADLAPEDGFILASRAMHLGATGAPRNEVLAALRYAQQKEPDLAFSRSLYGSVLLVSGRFDEARQVLHEAVAMDPDDSTSRFQLAHLATAELDFDTAERELRQAIRLHPELGYNMQLSYLLMNQGKLDAAEDEAREGIRIHPVAGQMFLAWIHHFRHHHDKALALWEDLLRRKAPMMAGSQLLAGMPALARELVEHQERLDQLLASGSRGASPREDLLLAWHAQFAQRFATAAHAYQRAFEADPEIPKQKPFYLTQAASCILRAGWPNCRDHDVEPPSWDVALSWMRQELQRQERLLEKADRSQRNAIAGQLVDNMLNPIHASARDPHIREQPQEVQQRWREYWSDLRKLLDRALDPKTD